MMRHKFHHEETLVSSRRDTGFITMRHWFHHDETNKRYGAQRRKTHEKGMGNK